MHSYIRYSYELVVCSVSILIRDRERKTSLLLIDNRYYPPLCCLSAYID